MDQTISKAIIVVTYQKSPWIGECLDSLAEANYPIVICVNPEGKSAYDTAAFYYAKEYNIKEFVVLHDSMIIKDNTLFDKIFSLEGNVKLSQAFQMCLGKFVLDKLPPLPKKPSGKKAAIDFETFYMKTVHSHNAPFKLLMDTKVFVEKHGQKRMVIENEYLTKYKGTWNLEGVID